MGTTELADEPLVRYLFDSSHFAAQIGRVKPRALEPHFSGTTSVFMTQGLDNEEIWALADREVTPMRGKSAIARADLQASHIQRVGLALQPDETPPRHANIVGWPTEKDQIKLRAQELAALASLVLR